jgi:hypothetical protein
VISRRFIAGSLFSLGVLATLFAPVASAQSTGRIERCAVQTPDHGTVAVAYTLDNQAAVQVAAAQCSYLISTGVFFVATNHVGLTDNPDFERVCMIEYSSLNSVDIFRSVYQPSAYAVASAACNAADDGSALVTWD